MSGQLSQASPISSPSPSSCFGFATAAQLSSPLGVPSLSPSGGGGGIVIPASGTGIMVTGGVVIIIPLAPPTGTLPMPAAPLPATTPMPPSGGPPGTGGGGGCVPVAPIIICSSGDSSEQPHAVHASAMSATRQP